MYGEVLIPVEQWQLTELYQAARRYEFVRRLNLQQFADIYKQNIAGVGTFDGLVDKEIEKRNKQGHDDV